jgi:acyl carrier protein
MSFSAKTLIELAIDHINETSKENVVLSKHPDSKLISSDSAIDSLSLVRLLLEIERLAEEEYDTPITVVDESAFEAEVSPFRTVGSLTEHVNRLIT